MRLVDFSSTSSNPPNLGAGTENRIFNLNLELSKKCNVFQFSFLPHVYVYVRKKKLIKSIFSRDIPLKSRTINVTEKYVEYVAINPFLLLHDYIVWRWHLGSQLPVFFPFSLDRSSLCLAKRKIIKSDLVQVEKPWLFDWVFRNTPKKKPIILVEHDLIYLMYHKRCKEKTLKMIREIERRAVERSDHIFVMSKIDMDILSDMYHIEKDKIHVVPNGVDTTRFKPSTEEEKMAIKRRFGLSSKRIALFVGGRHFPNVEAVRAIHYIASELKNNNIIFLIAGNVGEVFNRKKTQNILYTGYVKDIKPYFKMADIAINPVFSGGGTNIKMLEYLASGLPVVTTSFGARGLSLQKNRHITISDLEEFPDKIIYLLSKKSLYRRLSEEGRKTTVKHYDWKVIAKRAIEIYDKIANTRSE